MEMSSLHESQQYSSASSFYSFLFSNDSNINEPRAVTDGLNNIKHCEYINKEQTYLTNCSYANFNEKITEDNKSITSRLSIRSIGPINQSKIVELKNSTRKLLSLLDKILSETHSKIKQDDEIPKYTLKKVQCHEIDENCTVYNRLIRKCQCFNWSTYNDFMLQFNENPKQPTCDIGEVIKNIRILKKFLYMGDGYTKNALVFLNEGLSESSLSEKAHIIQACVHADICNIFEEYSIVTVFVSWPLKDANYGDRMTQILAADLVYKIANTEEGKRYLNFNTKTTDSIRHTLKKNASKFNIEIIEYLNATLNLLQQHFAQHLNISFYYKRNSKGIGIKTLMDLIKCHSKMTLEEVLLNLELLNNFCKLEHGKQELTPYLPCLLILLRSMLKEYDNSKINIIITNLLNNIISKSMINHNKAVMVSSTATEPIEMGIEILQICGKKKIKKHTMKSCSGKVFYTTKNQDHICKSQTFDKSRKVCENTRKQNIIVVPMK